MTSQRTSVRPAELLRARLDVESVGESDVVADDRATVAAVHVTALDLGRVAVPVRPEQVPVGDQVI